MRTLNIQLTGSLSGSSTVNYDDTATSLHVSIHATASISQPNVIANSSLLSIPVSKGTLYGINRGYDLAGRTINEVLDDLLYPLYVGMFRTMFSSGLNVLGKAMIDKNHFITVLNDSNGFFKDIEFNVLNGKMLNDQYHIKIYQDGVLVVTDELEPPGLSYTGYYLQNNAFINQLGSNPRYYSIPINIQQNEKVNRIMSEYTDEQMVFTVEIESRFNNAYRENFYLGRGVVIYSVYTDSNISNSSYSSVLNNPNFGFKSNLAVLKDTTELNLINGSVNDRVLYLFIPSIFGKGLIFKNKIGDTDIDMNIVDQNLHINAFSSYGYGDQSTNNIAFSGDFDVYVSVGTLPSLNLIIKR